MTVSKRLLLNMTVGEHWRSDAVKNDKKPPVDLRQGDLLTLSSVTLSRKTVPGMILWHAP